MPMTSTIVMRQTNIPSRTAGAEADDVLPEVDFGPTRTTFWLIGLLIASLAGLIVSLAVTLLLT
jgi:hypothetical protein